MMHMVQSSLTRAEATTRAEQIRVASYDVTVDLSGALIRSRRRSDPR